MLAISRGRPLPTKRRGGVLAVLQIVEDVIARTFRPATPMPTGGEGGIGLTRPVFASGASVSYVRRQVRAALDGVRDPRSVLLAYEPIWAIGSRCRPAAPSDVGDVFAALRADWGGTVRGVLVGGSVDTSNVMSILGVDGVDGLFVGRAAWEVDGFTGLLDLVSCH